MNASHGSAWLLVALALSASCFAQRAVGPDVRLETRLPQAAFVDSSLEDALRYLAETAGVNLIVRWERLATVGIERDQTISLHARNLRFGQVLWLVLHQAAGDGPPLAYRLDRELLMISTADDLNAELITRIYDVREIIMPLEQVRPTAEFGRSRDFVQTVNAQVAEGAVAVTPVLGRLSSGVSLWGSTNITGGEQFLFAGQGGQQDDGDEYEEARRRNLEELVAMIQAGVEPDSWAINGGRGTVAVFRDMLIIRNTPLVHQQIGGPIRE